ncbi:MAG: glycosyltransferase, partial [Lachnospiraceae bacterium]|nr:glycosyltransferase [Lachnospiraceae bacterium]
MKRIAFFQDNLDVGGIQKSIMNLLMNFDYENYQVDLYLSDAKSFWDVQFPPQLNVKYLRHIPRLYSFMPFDLARKLVTLDFSDVKEPYDAAIDFNSYQFSCALGALTVPARRRIMWIHNNVEVKLENEWKYRVLWANFKDKFKYYDEFVGVSKGVIEPFRERSGMYDKKYTVIQNTIDTREIFTKSAEETDFTVDESKLNFVAIGRLCHQKAYDIMLEEFSRLIQLRQDVHLYIIGDGDRRLMLEYQRDSLGLTDYVTFLGQKKNPFVYMDKMDAFVSTSRYEGQPLNVMEATALGLPLYCTKNLEIYSEGLVGCEDLVEAMADARRVEKKRDDLHDYNAEIIRRVKQLAEPVTEPAVKKKQVNIIALHLGVGGVEKAITAMANLFAERYDVRLYSVYKLPGTPAMPIDERVSVRFLLHDIPNRTEWKAAIRNRDFRTFWKESMRSVRILTGKRGVVKKMIRNITEGVIITTRHEHNLPLARYGAENVLKIGQLHHDHRF